jgi:hypothetical protein
MPRISLPRLGFLDSARSRLVGLGVAVALVAACFFDFAWLGRSASSSVHRVFPSEILPALYASKDTLSEISITTLAAREERITFGYQINSRDVAWPHCGFRIYLERGGENEFLDLTQYDTLRILASSAGGRSIKLEILVSDSTKNDPNRLRYLEKEVALNTSTTPVSIALEQFTTPSWWFEQHREDKNDQRRFLDQTVALEFAHAHKDNQDLRHYSDTVTVYEISLRRKPKWRGLPVLSLPAIALGLRRR